MQLNKAAITVAEVTGKLAELKRMWFVIESGTNIVSNCAQPTFVCAKFVVYGLGPCCLLLTAADN